MTLGQTLRVQAERRLQYTDYERANAGAFAAARLRKARIAQHLDMLKEEIRQLVAADLGQDRVALDRQSSIELAPLAAWDHADHHIWASFRDWADSEDLCVAADPSCVSGVLVGFKIDRRMV